MGKIKFAYNGVSYSMTPEEIEAAYGYRRRQNLLEDAERQLELYAFGATRDCLDEKHIASELSDFQNQYGIPYELVLDNLVCIINQFERLRREDVDDDMTWVIAIEAVIKDLEENRQKTVKGALHALLPSKLLDAVLSEAGISGEGSVSGFTKQDRRRLVTALKGMHLTVSGTRPFEEAVITRGGVSVSEVNSSTMESKLVKGLYFAGEVLDVDARTGGFNLQIAWSTGALAGRSIGQ